MDAGCGMRADGEGEQSRAKQDDAAGTDGREVSDAEDVDMDGPSQS